MDDYDADSVAPSSQSTIAQLKLEAKENVPPMVHTSPLRPSRPRKPPTVTPKRFTRFFTPRSSASGCDLPDSRSGRRLKDVTNQAINQRVLSRKALVNHDAISARPAKRQKLSPFGLPSPPQSSPIKYTHDSLLPLDCGISDGADDFSVWSDGEPDLPGLENDDPPQRITRLTQQNTARQLLTRSFGERSDLNLYNGQGYYSPSYCDAKNFVSRPNEVIYSRQPRSLCYSLAASNTSSLVACGDEDGHVHLLDADPEGDFSKPYISFSAHHNVVMDLQFSPDDMTLATAAGDQTARIFDMREQKLKTVLARHKSSVKQIRFRPDDPALLTTSGRDGVVNVWDLRCKLVPVQFLTSGRAATDDWYPLPQHQRPYASMYVGPAHRSAAATEWFNSTTESEGPAASGNVSITSIEHVPGRSHLLLSASEQNASLKLWDLRVAGRNTKSERFRCEIPLACTAAPPNQARHFGVAALALSTDGARAYSVCKDSTVWAYSTQHLILGSAPESVDVSKRTRISPPETPREGLGPLYGFCHPHLVIGTFYTKAAIRKATPEHDEMLAVGSTDRCAVLFPTDERFLRSSQAHAHDTTRPRSFRRLLNDEAPEPAVKVIDGIGTALVRGHDKEVTSLAFAAHGDLVTVSDDYKARCWRQDAEKARALRQCGEGEGKRWGYGWADAPEDFDDEDA